MNFKPNIPEYHDVSYIQTDSPGASSSTSSPTITATNMPYSMWSLYRPSFQPSSTAYPIYTHLPPSPGYMGYQLSSPTSTGFYSPTSQSSDYHHHPTATLPHISNATSTTSNTSKNSVNNNSLIASYANSTPMYTYQPSNYYNINSRESFHIIEPPPIPIPTQSRSMPLPVQQQQQQQQHHQKAYQQQMQFQVQMQSQPYSPQFVVGSPQTQSAKRGLPSSLKKSKRKHETQRQDNNEEQEVPGKRLRRTRSASASATTTTTTTTTATTGAATDAHTNVIPTKKMPTKNNKKTKKPTKKKKKSTTKSPDTTPIPSPLLSEKGLQDDDANTLNKLEDELSFLNDECATILMMLDSLRNAYLAAGPQQGSSLTTSPSSHDAQIIEEQQRRSTDFVQNRDIEKEMRIAYDDLMLQVRQVEKKINKVERKSQMITTQRSAQLNAKSPTNSVETQDQPENKEEENKSP